VTIAVALESLSAEAFAPFGTVIAAQADFGRAYFGPLIESHRPAARLDLSIVHLDATDLPLEVRTLERHPHSAQAFLPLDVDRYLVIVAPDLNGAPAATGLRAFVAGPGAGIVYRPGAWHHGMIALGRPGRLSIVMWCDGGPGDEEFRDLDRPVTVG